jgi:septum site-determining protein MinC
MSLPGKIRAVPPADEPALPPAFEIKGTVSSLTVLRLRSVDVARIEGELATRIHPFPQIFMNAPVIVDAGLLDGQPVPWEAIASILKAAKLVPVGAANVPAAETDRAVSSGFGVIQLGSRLRAVEPSEVEASPEERDEPEVTIEVTVAEPAVLAAPPAPVPTPAETAPVIREPLVVAQPVRGGQVVYARGVDLVARAPVNAGAQVIADGSIYIWAPLRGRALAGAQGRKDARIFCLSLEAELLSVAGEYILADEIPDALRGRPVQVFLDGERVRIAPL